MNNKLILILAIVGVLISGTVVLTFALSNSNYNIPFNQNNMNNMGEMQGRGYSDDSSYNSGSACNPSDYPCFKYPKLENQRGEGYQDNIPQTTLHPCQPKPVCLLCKEEIEQVRGKGHMDNLVKTKITC